MPKAKSKRQMTRTPKLQSPFIADRTRPLKPDKISAMAAELMKFRTAYQEWKVAWREAFKSGSDLPEFPVKNFIDTNRFRMSVAEIKRAQDENTALVYYHPIEQDVVSETGCRTMHAGSPKRYPSKPKDWDVDQLGEWRAGLTIQDSMRCFHKSRAEGLVEDSDANIVTINDTRYVVGTGGHDGSAVFLVGAYRDGSNYGVSEEAWKRLSAAGGKLDRVVFKIEDKPTDGDCVVVKTDDYDVYFLPGQVLTPGYLIQDGNEMTPAQIRKEDPGKGIRFKKIDPQVFSLVGWSTLWDDIRYRAKKSQDKTLANVGTTLRVEPTSCFPFGFRALQIGMVPYTGYLQVGDEYEWSIGLAVGHRSNFYISEGMPEVDEVEDEESEAEVDAEAEAVEKPKKKAKKATEKKSKSKGKKKSKKVEAEAEAEAPVLTIVSEEPAADLVEDEEEEVEEVDEDIFDDDDDDDEEDGVGSMDELSDEGVDVEEEVS